MDPKQEYHDPDYPEASVNVKEEASSVSDLEKVDKIKDIICREFTKELEVRENETMQIDQRMLSARRLLHRLRYSLVSSYYRDQRLQLTEGQIQDEIAAQHEPRARAEASFMLREGQRRLHPSVRKLLGKQIVDLEDIFRHRAPRNKIRRDYSAMLQTRNYTIAADKTKTLRPDVKPEPPSELEPSPSKPKKIPRHLDPKVENVLTLDEITRNKMKHRYRIIIGNTSKYAPAASQLDRSTHKWLLYVRGPTQQPDVAALITAVTVRLHHSYAPHHTVHIDKPPYHISRRGWGEFPAKVELHFALPDRNRPATVEHTIKLDRNFTGMQVLGAETVVDVWLYSTPEMLKYEFQEENQAALLTDVKLKEEPMESKEKTIVNNNMDNTDVKTENWMDFFTSETTELDVDEMIIKPSKKEINDTKNDLENLINSNVIPKENIKQEIDDEENITDKNNMTILNGQNCEFITPVIKGEQLQNCVNSDTKSIENSIEKVPEEIFNQKISPKKRIMKYMDPATGKIYYLEMDRNLDLTKVQEIVINSKGNVKTAKISPIKSNGLKNVRKPKGGVSLLKPEVKNLLKNENVSIKKDSNNVLKVKNTYTHIENDHCYLGTPWTKNVSLPKASEMTTHSENISERKTDSEKVVVKLETNLYESLCRAVKCFTCIRVAVNYLLKKIPIISEIIRDPDIVKHFPFIVEKEELYWKYDFSKRRNIEWSRAKLINTILQNYFKTDKPIWKTKQILIYSRLHGFYPIRQEALHVDAEKPISDWNCWNDLENTRTLESNMKESYPNASDANSLTLFNPEYFTTCMSDSINLTDTDEEIDIVESPKPVKVEKDVSSPDNCDRLTVLPVENEDDRLRFLFIEWKCADIGIELKNEDVGNGYSYSLAHAALLSAVRNFAEELVRGALAARLSDEPRSTRLPRVWLGSSSSRTEIGAEHVRRACASPRLHLLTARALGAEKKQPHLL